MTALRLCGLLAAALLAGVLARTALADELAAPKGPVILTIVGEITQDNRPAFDPFGDAFLNYHEIEFGKAAAFDRDMLQSLGMQQVTIEYEGWSEAMRFEGPRLTDVLAAAGAEGRPITVVALDGYGVDISAKDIAKLPWIVALKANGKDLAIGGRGPTWIVYRPSGRTTADDEARWGWAVFLIEVRQ